MPLDPDVKAALDRRAAAGGPAQYEVPPAELRARQEALQRRPGPEVAAVSDHLVPGPHGDVPVRVYVPARPHPNPLPEGEGTDRGLPGGEEDSQGLPGREGGTLDSRIRGNDWTGLPVCMWFHGGGWIYGSIDSNDANCRELANRAGVIMVSVDYRLSPENKFPVAFDDSFVATSWAAANAASFGGDPSRVGVAGMSAGGNLAATVALRARDEGAPALVHQSLIYPVLDRDFERPSFAENGDPYYNLSTEMVRYCWDCYLASESDGERPYARPMAAEDLSGLPAAFVLTVQYDPLRDEGEVYAERLRAAGVPTEVSRYDGVVHGFFNAGIPFERTWEAMDEVAAHLRRAFGTA